jgi:hypothetical protein
VTAMFAAGDLITLGVGVVAAIVAILAWRAALRAALASEGMERSAKEAIRIQQEGIEEMRKAEEGAARRHREELTLLLAQIQADIARQVEETSKQAHLVSLDLLSVDPLTVGIKNRSTSPIFEVDIIDVLESEEKKSWSWRAIDSPNSRRMTLDPGQGKLYVLRQHWALGDGPPRYDDPNIMGVHPFNRPQIVYGFTDAGGRGWWRLGGGLSWLIGAPVPADVSPWDGEKARAKTRRGRISQIVSLPSKQELFNNLSKSDEGDPESGTV